MLIYVIRRLLVAIPTILLLVIAAFAMMHLAPGGPFSGEKVMAPEIRQALEAGLEVGARAEERADGVGRALARGAHREDDRAADHVCGLPAGNGPRELPNTHSQKGRPRGSSRWSAPSPR